MTPEGRISEEDDDKPQDIVFGGMSDGIEWDTGMPLF